MEGCQILVCPVHSKLLLLLYCCDWCEDYEFLSMYFYLSYLHAFWKCLEHLYTHILNSLNCTSPDGTKEPMQKQQRELLCKNVDFQCNTKLTVCFIFSFSIAYILYALVTSNFPSIYHLYFPPKALYHCYVRIFKCVIAASSPKIVSKIYPSN